jgi:hypothetical protein
MTQFAGRDAQSAARPTATCYKPLGSSKDNASR